MDGRAKWISPRSPCRIGLLVTLFLVFGCARFELGPNRPDAASLAIQLGPRPFTLLDQLEDGALKRELEACREGPFRSTRFSIGHRGAPLQYPEHTEASYRAAARMGAGMIECDATFTRDRVLVCRHAQCDLATTTNILETNLGERCTQPFEPEGDDSLATARCCTSDFDWSELALLEAKMDGANRRANTAAEYGRATPVWRTDLYSTGEPILRHEESIALLTSLGVAMTPELKSPEVEMPFQGTYTQSQYARKLVDAYREAGVGPEDVRLQSFDRADLETWFTYAPEYAARAVWLIEPPRDDTIPSQTYFEDIRRSGIRTIAPPISMLLEWNDDGDPDRRFIASKYAKRARSAGLDLITWTLERSGRIRESRIEGREHDFYLGPLLPGLTNDGDLYRVIQALHEEVGVVGLFSDWPATVTYYANCVGLD